MKISRGKSRVRTVISCIIALICAIGIGYSGYKIIEWKIDSDKTNEQTEQINRVAKVEEIEDSDKTETIKIDDEKLIAENSPYWTYLRMNLIDVDFTELRKINSDVGGWVQVSGTNINYPFAKASNNDYYLTHSFDKSYNRAGWVFSDFRNHVDGSDKNLILYAHGRVDSSMFGTLRTILESDWLKNPDNFVIRTSNDYEDSLWQVFSLYKTPVTNDYIQTAFNNDEEFAKFTEMLKNRSVHDFQTTVSGSDNILTLSTCYNKTTRVVMHAKLIKRLTK